MKPSFFSTVALIVPGYYYLLKNNLAVKKGAAIFKMANVKKVVKLKGVAKK